MNTITELPSAGRSSTTVLPWTHDPTRPRELRAADGTRVFFPATGASPRITPDEAMRNRDAVLADDPAAAGSPLPWTAESVPEGTWRAWIMFEPRGNVVVQCGRDAAGERVVALISARFGPDASPASGGTR